MAFREIDDDLREIVRKCLPPTKPASADPGVTPTGCSNGILYALTTGCTWHDVPANVHDSRLYEPTLGAFEIPDVQDRPTIISADATCNLRCPGDSSIQLETRDQDQYPGQQEIPEASEAGKTIRV